MAPRCYQGQPSAIQTSSQTGVELRFQDILETICILVRLRVSWLRRASRASNYEEIRGSHRESPNNYSAYVPDLPGCVTTGKTVEEIKTNIREAIELHLKGLLEDGAPVPEPSSVAIEVELPVQPSAV